jgi:hypothetical protein
MAKRAAVRNQRRFTLRASRRDVNLGRAALAIPRTLVTLVTAAIVVAAAVGLASTVALAG